MDENRAICVVTQPVGPTDSAIRTFLDILGTLAPTSLVTAHLDPDSTLRDSHEVIEISESGTGDTPVTSAIRFLRNQLTMCRILFGRDEEVVWFFGATIYLIPVVFGRLLGRTVVIQPRGNVPKSLELLWRESLPDVIVRPLSGLVFSLQFLVYWMADAIVTYTPAMAEDLGLRRFEEKLYPHGARYADIETFSPMVPYEERKHAVGFVGRLDAEKNLETLADVAERLPNNVVFRFIGDGGGREWLETRLSEEIREGRVECTGWVEHGDLPTELNQFRLLLLPSHTEGLPTTLLESMACGTPCYATPVGG